MDKGIMALFDIFDKSPVFASTYTMMIDYRSVVVFAQC